MIPYKDLCTAIDRYRARVGAARPEGGNGPARSTEGGSRAPANGHGHESHDPFTASFEASRDEPHTLTQSARHGELEDHTRAMPVGQETPFPEVAGARVEVHPHALGDDDEDEHTSMNARPQGGLPTETNEIDLGSADVVGEEDLPE